MESASSISFSLVDIFQREQLILTSVNFRVEKGELVFLVGRVGSGKSSLIKTMNAEIPVFTGKAEVAGFDLLKLNDADVPFLRRKLGVVFQDFKLLSDRSVYNNLLFVLKATGWTDKKAMDARISEMLSEVEMQGHAKKMPHQLSGGEQQRVVIARALLNNPEIILADEPTGNLDHETSIQIMELFKTIHAEGRTVVMATHDKLLLDQFPARTLVCEGGKLIETKPGVELLDFRSMVE